MANVCLIYPRDINLNFFPLGIGYIAAFLKQQGHNVTFLDMTESNLELLNKSKVKHADIVGISITTVQLGLAEKIVDLLKKNNHQVKIVAGGIHPSYFKEEFLKNNHNIDFVIYGEGEITMNELCCAMDQKQEDFSGISGLIYRRGEDIMINPPRDLIFDLNLLPFPARELVNYKTYLQPPGLIRGVWTVRTANITTSRGCPGRCTFCGVNYLFDKRYRRRTVDNTLAEVDFLVSQYNIDSIYFMDDTFLMNTEWIEEFCRKLSERNYCLKWSCYGRVDTVNEKIIQAIKKAGCVQVEYGIESGSIPVLKQIKKNIEVDKIKRAIKLTKENNIRALGSFIFGFPDDNVENLMDSINLAGQLNLDFSTCYFATPYPASELYEQAVRENRIVEHDLSKWYVRNNKIWKVNLDSAILQIFRNKFLRKVRFKNTLFFFKNPGFLFNLILFAFKNFDAIYKSIIDSIKFHSFDDLGYYFYVHLSKGQEERNI